MFQKLYEIDVKLKTQKRSAFQDLPTQQLLSKSHYPFESYCPFFFLQIFKMLILSVLYVKNYNS